MASRIVFSKTRKRASPGCDSQDEMKKKRARKLTMCGKEGRHALVQGTSPEKVDDVESSSGGCSINSYKPYHGSGFCVEDHESDAESVCQCGYKSELQVLSFIFRPFCKFCPLCLNLTSFVLYV
ncbi:hypothetical protein HanRHA438_Chr03g0100781 [Helianthus annuus]|uniref:Uncharacterized protein n=1 Tax=Helianthus annuus TaxID=4232 RepID=A0A9K3JCU5_HELAN|nr:hypothetical protein HanXRQr2_Chr03g0089451 [Helianthus annuus]KAJ0495877.1 hypothetical protein HanIR_Chr12g0613831 [Helianthus annuus]KAJ0591624.1 hypothetical protein HanHA300_Chr03g0075371 [Helianthus annuus]KAJ0606518.1 hypothetical protein HanHA89_Chr03g0086021 [Helianthus annuus]KAJ0772510.1 hypothetical protein HanOQP8_Chr03g0088141 [Helianthus annuus]